MLNKREIQNIIDEGLLIGGDFIELFFEDSITNVFQVMSGKVNQINTSNIHGVGVRILHGVDQVYGHTNETSYESVLNLTLSLARSLPKANKRARRLKARLPYRDLVKVHHSEVRPKEKTKLLVEYSNIIKKYDKRIVQSMASLYEKTQKVLIANSKGVFQDDLRVYSRVSLQAVSMEGEVRESSGESIGRMMGFEIFENFDFTEVAKEVAEAAIKQLSSINIDSQKMPVVIHNGFGGVLFHEACGHPLEAESISKGLSPFAGKLEQKVASDVVSAYDDGTIDYAWGRTSFDDEGNPTQKNTLIENGILKGYLIDTRNGMKMKMKNTGSSRRESYKYAPTSRMNSTYIANGTEDYRDIIKDTKYGLFAKKLGGGTVVPSTGEFNFAVLEAYLIEDGKLTKSVKGAMLVGHGSEILHKIDRVANNLEFGQGMCGASSGSIPVDVGQPTLRVSEITVGGRGGNQ